jgi:ferredoxin
MKIVVDQEKCFGYASCVQNGPDVYVLDEEGCNRMQPFKVKPGFEEQARSGACACPVQAITVIDEPD